VKLYQRKQLEIVKLSSNDTKREGINGLFFEGNSTVATDGHKLIKVTSLNQEEKTDWPANSIQWGAEEKPFTIRREVVEQAIKSLPKKSKVMPILNKVAIGQVLENGKASIQTTDLDNTSNLETKLPENNFPDYQKVIPDYKDFPRVGISAKYLKEICGVLEKYHSHNLVTIYFNPEKPENHPIVITATDHLEGVNAEAVIMPMRL
jgi:DNA polymerase III sliding clamp (beta) subunit (PCNA family)